MRSNLWFFLWSPTFWQVWSQRKLAVVHLRFYKVVRPLASNFKPHIVIFSAHIFAIFSKKVNSLQSNYTSVVMADCIRHASVAWPSRWCFCFILLVMLPLAGIKSLFDSVAQVFFSKIQSTNHCLHSVLAEEKTSSLALRPHGHQF